MKNIAFILLILFLVLAGIVIVKRSQKNTAASTTYTPTTVPQEEISPTVSTTASPSGVIQPSAKVTIAPAKEISLQITSPQEGSTVTTSTITIKGKTAAGATVFINEKELKADSLGMFSTAMTLDEGENSFVIVANDDDGNFAETELNVTYDSG